MLEFLAHLVITAALLLVVSNVVKGISIVGWGPAILGALVLGIINATIWWIAVFFSLPLIVLTAGLFILVINALMLMLMSAVVPGIKIAGFGPAFFGALLLAVLNIIVDWLIRT